MCLWLTPSTKNLYFSVPCFRFFFLVFILTKSFVSNDFFACALTQFLKNVAKNFTTQYKQRCDLAVAYLQFDFCFWLLFYTLRDPCTNISNIFRKLFHKKSRHKTKEVTATMDANLPKSISRQQLNGQMMLKYTNVVKGMQSNPHIIYIIYILKTVYI